MNADKFVVLGLAFLIVMMPSNLAIAPINALQTQSYDFSDYGMAYSKIGKPSAPINVELYVSGIPSLGQTVGLTLTTTPLTDAPNTTVQILLPDGFVLVSGDLFWNGDKASAISRGAWTFGKPDSLYISVFETTARISDAILIKESKLSKRVTQLDPSQVLIQKIPDAEGIIPSPINITDVKLRPMPNSTFVEKRALGSNSSSGLTKRHGSVSSNLFTEFDLLSAVIIPASASPSQIQVIGYLYYRDFEGNLRPARWATVYIYDDDVLSGDDLLDTVLVQSNGYFESDLIDNTDPEWGTQDVYIRFVAANSENEVVDSGGSVYDGDTIDNVKDNVPDGVVDFGDMNTPVGEEGAWEIFDTLNTGWSYFINTLGYDHGHVTCIWYPGKSDTYVEGSNGYRIHIGDGDQMDEDVILHEYGHSIMFGIFGGFPPNSGGRHAWTGHYNPELAWSEGWATYASCIIQNDRYYDDTVNRVIHIDVECQLDGSEWDGDGNGDDTESAVCGLLWDIYDSNSDNLDILTNGPHDTFDVFRYYTTGGHHTYNIHEFWNGWFARGHNYLAEVKAIYYDHGVDYNNNPTCTIDSPIGQQSGTITISATASDVDAEDTLKVDFYYSLDDSTGPWTYIGSDSTPSGIVYSVSWDTSGIIDPDVWVKAVCI